MRSFLVVLALALAGVAASCPAPPRPVPVPPAPPSAIWWVDVVACKALDPCVPIPNATVQLHYSGGYESQTANADGYTLWSVPSALVASDAIIAAPGYVTARAHIDVQGTHDGRGHNRVLVTAEHYDPSGLPLEELAAIRGAMWPQAVACPEAPLVGFGPRPGLATNILSTDFLSAYSAGEQLAIVRCLRAAGYTHVVVGPLVDSDGYHGTYPARDWRGSAFGQFLDVLEFIWDHGLAPVVFIHPDGWSFEQTRDELTALLQQERAQRLIRIVVPSGWEPTRYEWSSCTWAQYVSWGRSVLPHALVLLHTVSDVDAPVGTDALCDDNGRRNGDGWARVVAAGLHGWLIQNGPYADAPAALTATAREFAAQFMADGDGERFHGVAWHFANAIDGWPSSSTWGPGRRIKLYASEHTAYEGFWRGMPEARRIPWGDLAIRSGADGYLDGGTLPVPNGR